jgi:hypothetical protein
MECFFSNKQLLLARVVQLTGWEVKKPKLFLTGFSGGSNNE